MFLHAAKVTSSKEVIKAFESIIKIFGPPKTLVTDRGSTFTSKEFAEFITDYHVKHVQNAIATPRANGQCERYNRTIRGMLAKLSEEDDAWHTKLTSTQQVLNNTYQRSIDTTPTQVLLGYDLRTNTDQQFRDHIPNILQQEETEEPSHDEARNETRRRAELKQRNTQADNEKAYNARHCSPPVYSVDDYVLVRSLRQDGKLRPKYQGPYRIAKVLDNDRYVVEDIPGTQLTQKYYSGIHSTDRLRPYEGPDCTSDSSSDSDGDVRDERDVRTAEAVENVPI